jgi:hypothetical protein
MISLDGFNTKLSKSTVRCTVIADYVVTGEFRGVGKQRSIVVHILCRSPTLTWE